MWAPVPADECAAHGWRGGLALLRDRLLARASWVVAVDCAGDRHRSADQTWEEVMLNPELFSEIDRLELQKGGVAIALIEFRCIGT